MVESDLKDYVNILSKSLEEITEHEHSKILEKLKDAKFQSQLSFMFNQKKSDFNEETVNHFLKQVKERKDNGDKGCSYLFHHKEMSDFGEDLPDEIPFEGYGISLWGLYLDHEKKSLKQGDSKSEVFLERWQNLVCVLKLRLKFLVMTCILKKEIPKKGMRLRNGMILIEKICSNALRKWFTRLLAEKRIQKLGNLMKRIDERKTESLLHRTFLQINLSSVKRKLTYKKICGFFRVYLRKRLEKGSEFFRYFRETLVSETKKKGIFVIISRVLARTERLLVESIVSYRSLKKLKSIIAEMLTLRIQNKVSYCFSKLAKQGLNSEIRSSKRKLSLLILSQKYQHFRYLYIEKSRNDLLAKYYLLRIDHKLLKNKYTAFWNFRVRIKYVYDAIYYNTKICIKSTVDKHLHQLKDDKRLVLKEYTKYKIEIYKGDKLDDSYYISHFDADNEDVENIQFEALKERKIEKQNEVFNESEFFFPKTEEKETQIDSSENDINIFKMDTCRLKDSLKDTQKEDNTALEKSCLPAAQHPKTTDFENSLNDRKKKTPKESLKKILIWQKKNEANHLSLFFYKFREMRLRDITSFQSSYKGKKKVRNENLTSKLNLILKRVFCGVLKSVTNYSQVVNIRQINVKPFERCLNRVCRTLRSVFLTLGKVNKVHKTLETLKKIIKNHLKITAIKFLYNWKHKMLNGSEPSRTVSPFRNDYILTDTNSEVSHDYDSINLKMAMMMQQEFQIFFKEQSNSIIFQKPLQMLIQVFEKFKKRSFYRIFRLYKVRKTLPFICSKTIRSYFNKIIMKKISKILNMENKKFKFQLRLQKKCWDFLSDYVSIQKLNPNYLLSFTKLQNCSVNQMKNVFLYLIDTRKLYKTSHILSVIKKYLKFLLIRAYEKLKCSTKIAVKVEAKSSESKTTKMLQKTKPQALRSARKKPKTFCFSISPILQKRLKVYLSSVLKASHDLETQKSSLIKLAKIVKKAVSVALLKWLQAKNQNKLFQARLNEKLGIISKIFQKFLKIRLEQFKNAARQEKKIETKMMKKNTSQLRAAKNKSIGTNILKKVLMRFVKNKFNQWKEVSHSRNKAKMPDNLKGLIIKTSLNTLKKNFALHLKSLLNIWARNIRVPERKPKPSLIPFKILSILCSRKLKIFINLLSQTYFQQNNQELNEELHHLADYKKKKMQQLKLATLRSISSRYKNRMKIGFIRWVNLLRLLKARLIVDKTNIKEKSCKKQMAPILLKAFSSNLFLSFHSWKNFTSLTKKLPKSRNIVKARQKSFQSIFQHILRRYFSLVISQSFKLNIKNSLLSVFMNFKNRLATTFQTFHLNSKIQQGRTRHKGLSARPILSRILSKRMVKPIICHGISENKLNLAMMLVKRTLLFTYKAKLEQFRVNGLYSQASKELNRKSLISTKQSFIIFDNVKKGFLVWAFNIIKSNTKMKFFALKNSNTFNGVKSLNRLLSKCLKPIFSNTHSEKKLKISMKILKRCIQLLYKNAVEQWKSASLKQRFAIVLDNTKNEKKTACLRSLIKGFYKHLKDVIMSWNLKSKGAAIKKTSRVAYLEKILKLISSRTLKSSFSLVCAKTETKKNPIGLKFVFEKYIIKKTIKRGFEIFKQSLFTVRIKTNNNLWQMKMSQERNKIRKEYQVHSYQSTSLIQLEGIFKQNSISLKKHAISQLKNLLYQLEQKNNGLKLGLKKVKNVILSSLQKAYDRWNSQIKWIPERTMIFYSKFISKLIEVVNMVDIRSKAKRFAVWKSQDLIHKLQQKYSCLLMKRLRRVKPNKINLYQIRNAFQLWKTKLKSRVDLRNLQRELEETKSRAQAYQLELQNLKKNRTFLYSGLVVNK